MLDQRTLALEFPQADGLIYLNHAAVAPWPTSTANAVKHFAEENVRLGASRYADWMAMETQLRSQLQRLINAPSADDIALLKNTSEGISLVACGLDWHAGDNVVSTDQEFPSNRIPWQAQQVYGVEFREVSLESDDPEAALIAACDQRTRVLTVSSVQYASGLRLDLARLGEFCRDNNILFFIDAIQSLGAIRFDAQAVHADFVVADAHKWMLGPEGIALFYSREVVRERLTLHQYGWHMVEDAGNYDTREWQPARSAKRFECGSSNMLGIHALSASLALLEKIGMQIIHRIIINNSLYLIDILNNINEVKVTTDPHPDRLAGIVNFRVDNQDTADIHRQLLKSQVICANRGGGIRFSPHFYITQEKLDKAIEILVRVIK